MIEIRQSYFCHANSAINAQLCFTKSGNKGVYKIPSKVVRRLATYLSASLPPCRPAYLVDRIRLGDFSERFQKSRNELSAHFESVKLILN